MVGMAVCTCRSSTDRISSCKERNDWTDHCSTVSQSDTCKHCLWLQFY